MIYVFIFPTSSYLLLWNVQEIWINDSLNSMEGGSTLNLQNIRNREANWGYLVISLECLHNIQELAWHSQQATNCEDIVKKSCRYHSETVQTLYRHCSKSPLKIFQSLKYWHILQTDSLLIFWTPSKHCTDSNLDDRVQFSVKHIFKLNLDWSLYYQ